MKTIYILTNPIGLYTDSQSFFPSLQTPRVISENELLKSFPGSSEITGYEYLSDAEAAVRKQRSMSLVRDENPDNIIGFTYRSKKAPVILEIQLINDLIAINPKMTHRVVSKQSIDLAQAAKVITNEKECLGTLPPTLELSSLAIAGSSCVML